MSERIEDSQELQKASDTEASITTTRVLRGTPKTTKSSAATTQHGTIAPTEKSHNLGLDLPN